MAVHLFQVGINDYPGTDSDLRGCLNDLTDLAKLLPAKPLSHVLLRNSQAIKSRILAELRSFVKRLKPSDWGIVQYSGHGSWVPDENDDENDRRDECWVPYDWSRSVLDDELLTCWKLAVPQANILLITDSCNNGTVFRMTMPLFAPGRRAPRRVRFLSPEFRYSQGAWLEGKPLAEKAVLALCAVRRAALSTAAKTAKEALLPNVIHFAACTNVEYAADATFGSRANGAFTAKLIAARKALRKKPTVAELFNELRKRLPNSQFPQTPVLNAVPANLALTLPF